MDLNSSFNGRETNSVVPIICVYVIAYFSVPVRTALKLGEQTYYIIL